VEGKDEKTIADHVAMLKLQAAKSVPDVLVITTRMNKTFADRRDMVYNGERTSAILDKYPTLGIPEQASKDF